MSATIVQILLFVALYFEVFLLLAFLEKNRNAKEKKALAKLPRATVIVPCYNEGPRVKSTMDSLLALEYPKENLQIIVVDDGSTDNTWENLSPYASYAHISLFKKKDNGGKHTALNLGISHATGDFIGCLDADSTVSKDALTEILCAFEDDPALMAVTPAIKNRSPKGVLQRIQYAEYSLMVFFRQAFALIDGTYVTPGPFSFFRKEVFEKLGQYREAHNTEDLEIALRMQSNKMRIGNAPDAHVYTATPSRLSALIRQRVRWTYGFLRNFFEYRHLLFRPSHGSLGMLILPTAFFSIFSALFLFAMMITSATEATAREYLRYDTIGFSARSYSIDWYYFNTGAAMFIIGVLIALTFVLMLFGMRLSGEKPRFTGNIALYFILYGFIAPLWLTRAVWRAALARKTDWAKERNAL